MVLLIVTFLKGWLWSVIIPLWQASDEYQHFGYAQEMVRQQTWPVTPPQAVPIERSTLLGVDGSAAFVGTTGTARSITGRTSTPS